MKKIRAVFGYFIMSAALFLGGVSLDSGVSGTDVIADLRDRLDNMDDPADRADDPPASADDAREPDGGRQDDAQEDTDVPLYYYSLLDDGKKEYYEQLDGAVASQEDEVTLKGISYEEAEPIFLSVTNDHPEYFWIEPSYTYQADESYVKFMFNYNCEGGEKDNRQRVIDQQSAQIVDAVPADSTDYEKVKTVFETIVDRTQYDKSAPDNQNIYSVFGNWSSVCAGYARATKYLLDQMGVECIYVTGDAGGEAHAWNIVNCDGAWYCVDATWGDPVYQEGVGVDVDTTSYEYLCCTEQMLFRTHTPEAMFTLPVCTDTSLEYYRLEGRYLTEADAGPVLDLMKADIDAGEERTDIQFSEPDIYEQVMAQLETILQDALRYQGTGDKASYQWNENTCKITVFWES